MSDEDTRREAVAHAFKVLSDTADGIDSIGNTFRTRLERGRVALGEDFDELPLTPAEAERLVAGFEAAAGNIRGAVAAILGLTADWRAP